MDLYLPPKPAIIAPHDLDATRKYSEDMRENERFPYWKARQENFREKKEAMLKGLLPLVPLWLASHNAPLTITGASSGISTVDSSGPYDFGTQLTGTANPLRWNVLTSTCSGATVTTSSTINGQAVTAAAAGLAGIHIAYNPTGTDGNLTLTVSGAASYVGWAMYSLVGLLRPNAFDTEVGATTSFTIAAPKGGVGVVAARMTAATAISISGTNYTADIDSVSDTSHRREFGNISAFAADDAAYALTCSGGGTLSINAATWAP
jgi:hypothetical protein